MLDVFLLQSLLVDRLEFLLEGAIRHVLQFILWELDGKAWIRKKISVLAVVFIRDGIWNLNRGVHVKCIRIVILNEGDVAEGVIEKNSAIILAIEFRSEIWMAMGKLEIALKPFELDAREMGIIERSLDGSI